MKCSFSMLGKHYHAPTKKEAKAFLDRFGERSPVYRFITTWKFKTVERAPSYQNTKYVRSDRVEFGMI